MRTRMLAFSTIFLCGVVAAQTPLPGTFNTTPPQNTQQINTSNGGYIISTPTISLGDGITPTVVTSQDTVNISTPQNTSLNGPSAQVNTPATTNETTVATNAPQTPQARYFDFVTAPDGGNSPIVGSMADTSVSLGDLARKARNGKQLAKHSITNADVNALNGASSDSTQPTDGSAPQANPQSPNGTTPPAYAQPSNQGPFGVPNDGTKPNAQQGEGVSPRGKPANPAPTDQEKPKLPLSSSSLPLVGALGAVSTLAGIVFFKTR